MQQFEAGRADHLASKRKIEQAWKIPVPASLMGELRRPVYLFASFRRTRPVQS